VNEEEQRSPTEEQRREKSPATVEGRDIDLRRELRVDRQEEQTATRSCERSGSKRANTTIEEEERRSPSALSSREFIYYPSSRLPLIVEAIELSERTGL
jgi:hypothetical protein